MQLELSNLTLARPAAANRMYARHWKRWFDVTLTLVALPIILPVALVIAALIKLDSPGPALIKVQRLGKDHSRFFKYKFRTMAVNAEKILQDLLIADPQIREEYETTYKIRNDPRVTRFGKILRKTSLDELAQVLNVMGGTM